MIPLPKENSVGTFSIIDMKKYVFTVSKGKLAIILDEQISFPPERT
jgi:hypothetical protein